MMSQEKRTKFSGGAKPRTHLLPMMALVVVGLFALAGVVSADDYYKGAAPVTTAHDTVSGGVWVDWKDGWNITPMDWSDLTYENTTTFTSIPATGDNVKYARLYVVPYTGHMTNNNKGNLTVVFGGTTLADHVDLNLEYFSNVGPNYSYPGGRFLELNRVTSDYVAIFNVTGLINSNSIVVDVTTGNRSDLSPYKFDGRIKEVKLVVAYNDGDSDQIQYWVNEGHDPVTKYDPNYIGSTTFADVPEEGTVSLWVDYLASPGGQGTYTWNTRNWAYDSMEQGVYSGLLHKTWTSNQDPYFLEGNNVLTYDNTTSYYKMIVGVLTVQ